MSKSKDTLDTAGGDFAPEGGYRPKLEGYHYWRETLKSPKHVLGPMVDGSEAPFRVQTRRHGTDLTYSPMMLSPVFATSEKHRSHAHTVAPEDRPFIVQFCGTDPETVVTAARYVQDECDGVDLNMGCPQMCAKKGGYGAFLPDDPELACSIVNAMHQNLTVPVTCKIRLNPHEDKQISLEKTIDFAVKLQANGCQVLTVHGRTRHEKGSNAPHANWSAIREIKRHLNIPVIANGSIASYADVEPCLQESGADAVMAAYAMLYNPYLFEGIDLRGNHIAQLNAAREYYTICQEFPTTRKYQDNHVFALLRTPLSAWPHMIAKYERSKTYEAVMATFDELEHLLLNDPNPQPISKVRAPNPIRKPEFDPNSIGEGDLGLFSDE